MASEGVVKRVSEKCSNPSGFPAPAQCSNFCIEKTSFRRRSLAISLVRPADEIPADLCRSLSYFLSVPESVCSHLNTGSPFSLDSARRRLYFATTWGGRVQGTIRVRRKSHPVNTYSGTLPAVVPHWCGRGAYKPVFWTHNCW